MGNWINERRMSGTRKESGEGKEISRAANTGVETVATGWLGPVFCRADSPSEIWEPGGGNRHGEGDLQCFTRRMKEEKHTQLPLGM